MKYMLELRDRGESVDSQGSVVSRKSVSSFKSQNSYGHSQQKFEERNLIAEEKTEQFDSDQEHPSPKKEKISNKQISEEERKYDEIMAKYENCAKNLESNPEQPYTSENIQRFDKLMEQFQQ